MTQFNKIKQSLKELAISRGISEEELFDSWSVNYRADLDAKHASQMMRLEEYSRVFREAMRDNDLLTARSALVHARVIAHSLSIFFDSLMDDFILAAKADLNQTKNPELDWPSLLDKYEFPEKYQLRDN